MVLEWGPRGEIANNIHLAVFEHVSSVQNPSIIPSYWLVNRDSPIGLL